MTVAILSPETSTHTGRWVNALSRRGMNVHLITLHHGGVFLRDAIEVHYLPVPAPLGYVLNASFVRKILRRISPDLLHTHQASGYGTLGSLASYTPSILSVWGADVYDTPKKTLLHREIIRWNLRSADWVCSTSDVMAEHTLSLQKVDHLSVTPFGVDTSKFAPNEPKHGVGDGGGEGEITIGTVKTLKPKYGIDVLLRSFRELLDCLTVSDAQRCRLLIVGGGPQRSDLQQLSNDLGVGDKTTFAGRVPHEDVPDYLNQLDIYVAMSRLESESFGVAVLEASSCGVPVVVSDVGGLPEVVRNGETGIVVESESPDAAANAIRDLVENEEQRRAMGKAGREHVVETYEWEECVSRMIEIYEHVVETTSKKTTTHV
ncbi:glycosyltransferase [Salinibacter sp.]|uniref:glycosyltransferase n=1 Tax=Salinibacter sp. TaxID=2065818 RepID=UPI0021E706DA|nr:glycosyltransferase [Salinibacter sp.]